MKVIILYVIAIVFVVNGYSQQTGTKKYKRVPRLDITVSYPDGTPVDSAFVLVYDDKHNFICEGGYTDKDFFGSLIIINDSLITRFGKYYLKVSKKGYKTVETEIIYEDRMANEGPMITLEPNNVFSQWWKWGIFVLLGFGVIIFMVRRYRR
ncbi:hypothetical protein [uncultured Butyricimonas sp.]|uniref:hypothetical protein n=1 Tax=uncultured Butyricimonas sp. TaxID=1268785 RepID=UPI002593C17E|nr:hypothetical protein [uncultured Butyricimonas sp.]